MDFNQYQEFGQSVAIYPKGTRDGLFYAVLGLANEAGEVAGKLKKSIRDDGGAISEEVRKKMIDELGDVQWYISAVAYELGVDLEDIATANIEKLFSRKERGVLGGSGDNR